MTRALPALICISLLALGCNPPASSTATSAGTEPGTETVKESDKENLLRTTLSNGLKVALVEDHSAPVVALNVWVRTGSGDEEADEAGMAHVFEHMLFKGTERRAVGEIARTVEAAGGNINAFTSFDMTVYHITMASRDAVEGVDVLADAVQHSTFDPEELAKESEVVVEEINRGEDSPGRVLSQAVFGTTYQVHPYRLPVIGTEESVRSFTREGLLEFFARWYVPNNMTFVAVGDFDSQAMLKEIEKRFEDAKPNSGLSHSRTAEPVQTETRAIVVRRPFQQTQLALAYPITAFADEDTAYLDLLSGILGGGETSRLYLNVKDRKQLVHHVSASSYTPLDRGLFMVDAALEPENIEATMAAISIEIERLREFGPSRAELERARVNLLSSEVREKETVQGQARKYGYFETLAGGLEEEERYLERVRNASLEDLTRVAHEYLRPERLTVATLLPEEARPGFDDAELLAAASSSARSAPEALAQTDLGSGILRYELPNGLRVIVKQNEAVPLVSMRMSFLGGQLAETEQDEGVSSFLSEVLERGTEQRNATQLAGEIEDIAAGIGGFSGRNSFGLTASFLSESLDTGLELFADVLLNPAFDPDEIEKVRADTLAAIERREDNLAQQSFALFAEAVFPGHPYRFRTLGTPDSVKDISREMLQAYYGTYAHPSNGVLAIVGDVDPDAVVITIASLLSDWNGGATVELPDRTVVAEPKKPLERELVKNKQQVHIVMGFLGLEIDDPETPALDVLTQVLSGQGGRLFLELRDRRSLAYSVTAFSIEGVDRGSFGVYIASGPEKLDEAVEGLRAELQRILDDPPSPEELERAKAYLMGSQAVSLQRYGTQASLLSLNELYGLGATHHLEYEGRVEAVGIDEVTRIAQRIIDLDAPIVAMIK